mgnify:FL=1|jgi:hypothetical protein|tara:strand:- start:118 stop:762 length:645 start_codon:yes stop_codon:yes gene_type:complete
MGFLDNSSVTVDAILTKRGRELLAEGRDKFLITQFALADDEVDYDLWNPAHSLGSDYYGIVIENMPVLEAITDENYLMKYKLLSLPKSTVKLPFIEASTTSIVCQEESILVPITVTTKNGGNENLGYTAVLLNSDVGQIAGLGAVPGKQTAIVNMNSYATGKAQSVTGTAFQFQPTTNLPVNQTTTTRIIIIGNETGGRTEIDVTVNPKVVSNA